MQGDLVSWIYADDLDGFNCFRMALREVFSESRPSPLLISISQGYSTNRAPPKLRFGCCSYLIDIEGNHMGLTPNKEAALKIAEILLNTKEDIITDAF